MKEIEKKIGNNVKSFLPKKKNVKKNNKKQTSKKASGSVARIEY